MLTDPQKETERQPKMGVVSSELARCLVFRNICFQNNFWMFFQDKLIFFHISKETFLVFWIFCRSMLRSNVASNAEVQEDARSVNCPTQISCDDAKYSPYRFIHGSCNNLNHPNWGTIFSLQPRYQPAQYDDGI